MTKPVTIPNTFATATTAIPLSNLDADFSTVATAMNDANTYSNYAADTGSANAYVVTLTGISAIYSAGLRIQFKAGNANTTASTLNVNAQGAKNITYQDASAIASGTIAANSIVDVMYDGTQFLLMNDPAGGTGGDVVGPASATDNAIVRFDGTTGKLVQNSVVTIADSTGDVAGVGALSMSGNLTLSGGTANGVLYLDGSKVATSGSALTFDGTNLAIGGSAVYKLTVDVTGGSAAGLFKTNQSTSDLYLQSTGTTYSYSVGIGASADSLRFLASAAEQMRLTSTGLGIGTSSPGAKLDVRSAGTYTGEPQAILYDTRSVAASIGGGISFGGTYTGSTQTSWAGISGLKENATDGNFAGVLAFFTRPNGSGASERMRLDSSGNLGLGVTPSGWGGTAKSIDIGIGGSFNASTSASIVGMASNSYYDGGADRYKTTAQASAYTQYLGAHAWYTAPSGTAGNAISFTQALTLDALGNLLLGGTSTPTSSAGNLVMFNGTAPTGNVTNGCTLFCEDVSSSSELKVRDEAGNVTTLSPHNFSLIPEGPSEDMAWSYYSERDGKRINIDMLKAIRLLEKISGEQLVYEA